MKYTVVAVYDQAMAAFGRPVFTGGKGIAIRSFSDEVRRPAQDNELFKHPSDHTLYFLGCFDDEKGQFVECPREPERLVSGNDVKMEGQQ